MLARNGGFERYVGNKKPLISFTQLGCCDAPERKYELYKSHVHLLNFILFVSIISHLLKEENFNVKYSFYRPGRLNPTCVNDSSQWRTEGGGVWGVQAPPPEIPKALQNRAKLNPIMKT